MYEISKNSLSDYYKKTALKNGGLADKNENEKFFAIRNSIFEEMDKFYSENENIAPALLKSKLHTLMAESFEPVIFEENPFFFEMGMREADSWGLSDICPSHWIRERVEEKIYKKHPIKKEVERHFAKLFDLDGLCLCTMSTSFDIDHHTLGYTDLFSLGINGIIEKIEAQKANFNEKSDEYAFLSAAKESCLAVIKIAEKFSQKAEEMLLSCKSEKQKKYLEMIAKTAKIIPANPPKTFYEGLSMLLFTREVSSTIENIGVSHLGHVDKLLGKLYENDLNSGAITEEEARELIGIWMLHTDIKFDLEHTQWPETSTCIQLGGCDENGEAVYNDATKMFIEEHSKLNLVNPKLNCRYFEKSPREYLTLIGDHVLKGHNTFVLINDDIIISGLLKSGVELKDARRYVNGGCQETMIEGLGHTEGVAYYLSLPRLLDLFLRYDKDSEFLKPIENAETFDEFYFKFIAMLEDFFSIMSDQRNFRQSFQKESLACPFFSVTQEGCIENGKDYSIGGAKYNFSTVSLIGLGTLCDSLYAIKKLVYDEKIVSLSKLNEILEKNWEGFEDIRNKAISISKYGHNDKNADDFANAFLTKLNSIISSHKNERGGNYIPSLFAYYHFETFSHKLRAMPDGRKYGEIISAGAAPSTVSRIKDITLPVKSMQNMDFASCGGGSVVLDVQLPLSNNMTKDIFASFIYSCGKFSCPTLQPNVVSVEELLEAKENPEKHKNLIVRICGLSAYFVALTDEVQNEIIARNLYSV